MFESPVIAGLGGMDEKCRSGNSRSIDKPVHKATPPRLPEHRQW